jgi:protein-S-isoprenylcysteine O-methyltransferase Ste14
VQHLLIQHDHAARAVFVGVVAAAAVAEVAATYLGQPRDARQRIGSSVAEALFLARRRDGATANDHWTKQILVLALLAGLLGGWAVVVDVPSLRTGANTWWTLVIGAGVALAGVALRSWAVWTLGRYFRREVTIEADQPLITTSPFRWVRHPAYAGNLLTYGGLGLALGSWVSAAVVLTVALIGVLPRIKVEERTLEQAFGPAYIGYEAATARLIPYVW